MNERITCVMRLEVFKKKKLEEREISRCPHGRLLDEINSS
jgi:hypothetical protein